MADAAAQDRRGSIPSRLALAIDSHWTFVAAAIAPIAAVVATLWLIVPTVLPDVTSWDTAEFQTVLPVMGTAHPTGFPSYVILGWFASVVLAPFGSPAYRVDLLQAFLASVAVGGTVVVAGQLGAPRLVAFATGFVMATTLLFWRLSTHADPHMFHVALVALLLALLLGWESRRRAPDEAVRSRSGRWLVAAAFTYAVAFANHSLAMLLVPGIAAFVLAVDPTILGRWERSRFGVPWGLAATCIAVALVTIVLLFLELPVRALMHAPLVYGRPDTWSGFWYVVLAEQFTSSLIHPFSDLAAKSFTVLALFKDQLGPLLLLLPIGFLAAVARRPVGAVIAGSSILIVCLLLTPVEFANALRAGDLTPFCIPLGLAAAIALRPRFALLTGLWFTVTCWFAMSYVNADIDRYYLGPLLILFTWIGLSLGEAIRLVADALAMLRERLGRLARPRESGAAAERTERTDQAPRGARASRTASATYTAMLAPLVAILLIVPQADAISARYQSKGHVGGANENRPTQERVWLEQVMAGLPQNSVVISWWSYSTILWYGQRVEGMRPDIFVADDRTRIDMGLTDNVFRGIEHFRAENRPLFLIRFPSDLPAIEDKYVLKPWFNSTVYQVVGPVEGSK